MNVPLRLALLQSPIRSQVRLAAVTGIAATRLSKIVNGWVNARSDERDAIASAVGRPVGELFDGGDGAAAA
jgi:hypothetical protein